MSRPSLENDIIQFLRRSPGVRFSVGEIEDFAKSNPRRKYNAETGRKRAGELFKDGKINHEVKNGISYYWVDEPKREIYGQVTIYENGQPVIKNLTRNIW